MTFLNISSESEVYLLCRDYPVLVDLSSNELVSSHFMRSRITNFRAFKLPLVHGLSPKTNKWARYVSIPRLVGSATYLLSPHQEGGLPEKGFRSSSTLCVSLSAPDQDHWSIHANKKFTNIVKHLAEECLQSQKEAEDKEVVEVKEEDAEEQGGLGAATAATTTAELPISTASMMEINEDREGPNSEAPPPCSASTQRPLERMMRDITLQAKDGDIIFPITPVGGPPPYNHELLAKNCKKAKEAPSISRQFKSRGSEAGSPDPGGASHGSIYQDKPDGGGGSEYQPPRIIHCHGVIWRHSPRGAENSSRAYSEQPGLL